MWSLCYHYGGDGQPRLFCGDMVLAIIPWATFTNRVVSITYVEKLCLLSQCTPDELYMLDEGKPVPPEHPMHKLKPKPKVANPVERLNDCLLQTRKSTEVLDRLEKSWYRHVSNLYWFSNKSLHPFSGVNLWALCHHFTNPTIIMRLWKWKSIEATNIKGLLHEI